jgi:gliding motility-associated-like protein
MNKLILGMLLSVFFAFNIKAQSDNCATATSMTPTLTSCVFTSGFSAGATQSIPGCSGNADDDVWFSFVANSNEMTVKVDPSAGYDPVFQLFSGGCSGTSLGCRDINGAGINEKYTYIGLTPGNTYHLRIYHYASGSGSAAFKLCVSGLAPPTNTNPCSAYLLPALSPACNFGTYSIANHLGSGIATPSSCGGSSPYQGGYAGGDMWFKLVVPASGNVEISTLPGTGITDAAMALYTPSTSSCSSLLTQISCNDDRDPGNSKYMPYLYSIGNTPGDTLYVRIWEYSNNSSGKFKICASTPDNDDCPTALQICDLNGYSGSTSPQYNQDRPSNMRGIHEAPAGGVFGMAYNGGSAGASPVQIDNNSWITFVASSTSASFTVDIEDCLFSSAPTGGLQMQIFDGSNCTSFSPRSNFLETRTSQAVNAINLISGNTYYIVIDGFRGDVCSYTISANSGVQVVTVSSSASTICTGTNVNLTAQVFGSGTYFYSWYSVPAGGPYGTTGAISASPTVTTEYFVNVTGLCGEITKASFKVWVDPTPSSPTLSTTANPICPNGTTTITAVSSSGSIYNVYNASSGGIAIGSSPYVYNPNGFSGNRNLYIEAETTYGCKSATRTLLTINSQDNTAPSISCVSNQVITVNTGCSASLPDYRGLITTSDNCFAAVTNITQSPVSGTVLTGHNTNQVITMTAIDSAGNPSSCTFIVNLLDNTPPQINCPGNTTGQVDNNCQFAIPDYRSLPTSTDNCTTSGNMIYNQLPTPGTLIGGVGTIQIISLIAIDGANNRDTCTFTLTLFDQTPATITCPADQNDTVITEGCVYSVPDYTSISNLASDNCSNGGGSANIAQVPAQGTLIDLSQQNQSYLVTLTYTDASSNQSTCSFTVNAVCLREVEIPQFYSPNGDGVNDYLVIKNLIIYPSNTLRVFNRWGGLVYEMKNYDNSWGGKTSNGIKGRIGKQDLPSATYFYIFDIKDKESETGFIHIEQ